MDTKIGRIVVLTIAVLTVAVPMQAVAGVDVNVSIPLFGLFYEPQPVYVAPPAYGYGYAAPPAAVPAPAGAVFHGGYWYLPSGGSWYISAQTGGPWVAIGMDRVPYAVVSGPVLMPQAQPYYGGYGGPSVGISINPWINIGGHGGRRGGHGHGGHDD